MGLRRKLNEAIKPVTHTEEEQARIQAKREAGLKGLRHTPLPTSEVVEVRSATEVDNAPKGRPNEPKAYTELEVRGSNDKIYKVVIPSSYIRHIPRKWEWNEERYKTAELLASGMPMTDIAKAVGHHKMVIYGWLQHPEFKEHVDGLILESGWANKRERIAGLNRVTQLLFDKVTKEIGHVKLTDKSIGAVLGALQTMAKQLAQEKEEFVENAKIEQTTTVTGTLATASINIEALLSSKDTEERRQLEDEFNSIGDDIIRAITGDK